MKIVFALLSILAFSYAYPVPTPGKELVYNYIARIRVGTYEPVSYASQFVLHGKLHLQHESQDSTLVRFTDLSYKLYNGELNHHNEYESKLLPMPQDTADLLRIFRIQYDEDGKLKWLTTESGERKYSKNIKKAIASLLQLDRKNLQLEREVPHRRAFVTEERSVYGRGLEEYNVEYQGNQIIVQKMRNVRSSRHWYAFSNMKSEPVNTEVTGNSPLSASSQRLYTLTKTENGDVQIKHLEAHGGVYVHLLNGAIDAQYISVNQTMNLLEVIPIESKYRINSEDRTEQIEVKYEMETDSGAVVDLTSGRHNAKQEHYVRLVQRALEDAVSYLEDNQITLETPDVRKGQAINRLHQLMSHLQMSTLEQVYNTLSEKTGDRNKQICRIYQQMLPLIGTRATIVFVRNLVRDQKVDDEVAVDMLSKLPFHVQMPTERMLTEVSDLIDLNKCSVNVRRSGVLCYSSLIHKVYLHKMHSHQQQQHYEDNRSRLVNYYFGVRNVYPFHYHEHTHHQEYVQQNRVESGKQIGGEPNTILDKYVRKFMRGLEEAQDYQTQLLNLYALFNIKMGNVNKYLEKYVTGQAKNSNRHNQFIAMAVAMEEDVKNPERVHQLYWPIFTNRKLHLELRSMAYVVLVNSQLTMNKLWNIYWFLQTEQCPELYNFVYTHLQSLCNTKNPTLQEVRINAAQIMRYMRKPLKQYMSGVFTVDYQDPKYNFGAMLQSMMISTTTSKTLFIDITNNVMNVPFQLYSMFLKIDGLDQSVVDRLPKEKIVRMSIAELEELMKIITSLPDNKNIHVEYSLLVQNQVVRFRCYDQSSIKELIDGIQNLMTENNNLLKNSLQIHYNILSQIVMTNDLGFPTTLQMKSVQVENNLLNLVKEVVNKITNVQGDVRLHTSIQSTIDVGFYNPVVDIWQGVQRVNTFDMVLPVNFNLAMNSQQHSVKLTLNLIQDQQKGTIGMRNHVKNLVYIVGDEINNYLRQSNSHCSVVEEVTTGKQNKKIVPIMSVEDDNTGLRYEVTFFDNERQTSRKNLMNLMSLIMQQNTRQNQGRPVVGLLLTLRNMYARMLMTPGVGTSGLVIRAVPSTQNKISHIDLSLRLNQEVNREESLHLPSTRLNSRLTYSVKQPGDKLVKTWDVNAVVELNAGHTVNNFKVQISKIVPDAKDYRICIDGVKTFVRDGVSGHLSIAVGHSTDNKCVKDEVLVDVTMKGEYTVDQVKLNRKQQQIYDECSFVHSYNPLVSEQIYRYQPINCIERHTSIRRYVYDVKTTRIPEQMRNYLLKVWGIIEGQCYMQMTHKLGEQNNQIEKNNVRVIVDYMPYGNEMNVQVLKPQETYKISAVQTSHLLVPGVKPDNYHFSQKFMYLYNLGLINSCFVNQERMLTCQDNMLEQTLSKEWMELIKDKTESVKFSVAVRKTSEQQNQLGLRIVSQEQTLEIQPYGDQYQVLLNGQPLSVEKNVYRHENWFSVGMLNDEQQSVILHIHNYGLYIDYNGQTVKMDFSKSVSSLVGKCVNA